jgi:hypothetical protein
VTEFDEQAAERVLAELAATTDLDLTADIFDAIWAVEQAWSEWRADVRYPYRDSPFRAIADDWGASIAAAVRAIATVPPDDLHAAVRAASYILGESYTSTNAPELVVGEAVERLRFAAKTRPQQVRDARTLMRRSGNQP